MGKIEKLINNCAERLTRKQQYFKQFDSIGDWIYSETEENVEKDIRFFQYIKSYVQKKYQSKDIFVSPAALDDIIFYTIVNYNADKVFEQIDNIIINSGLNRNSVVILPLHSFGITRLGLKHLGRNMDNYSFTHNNFRIYAQTNSFDSTIKNILHYLDDIGLPNRRKIDLSLFEHFYNTRSLVWLERNPIMLLHFKFSQVERFDNLRFILEKAEFITNKLYFIYALSKTNDRKGSLFSTKNTNNWETLDINHFLTITTSKGRATVNCLPVHFSNILVFDTFHMNIELNLKMPDGETWFTQAIKSIDKIYFGNLNYRLYKTKDFYKFYRFANSLKYFRRSIKSIATEDKIINLQTAFEILLLDRNQRGNKRDPMLERLWAIFRLYKQAKKKDIYKNMGNLIEERNSIIHDGVPPSIELDYDYLNHLYCRLILNLVNNLKKIDSTQSNYLSRFYDSL